MAHAGSCNESLLQRLAPAHPPLAAAGSAVPVCGLEQEAQHLMTPPLSSKHQHTPARAVHVAHLRGTETHTRHSDLRIYFNYTLAQHFFKT